MSDKYSSIITALKCGEYNGADIMKAWCAIQDQQATIDKLVKAVDATNICLSNLSILGQAKKSFDLISSNAELIKTVKDGE